MPACANCKGKKWFPPCPICGGADMGCKVDCRVEAAEVDRLRAENASLRHALTVVRAELETALRHLRGC